MSLRVCVGFPANPQQRQNSAPPDVGGLNATAAPEGLVPGWGWGGWGSWYVGGSLPPGFH